MSTKLKIIGGIGAAALLLSLTVFSVTFADVDFKAMVAKFAGEKVASQLLGEVAVEVVGEISEPVMEESDELFGAFPGGEIFSDVYVHGDFTYGGKVQATTTSLTAYTLQENDLRDNSVIDIMVNTGNTTLTMPATTTMDNILKDVGSSRKWLIHNATSSTITLTLAAGAGMDLVSVTNADDVIDAGEWMEVTCSQIFYRATDNENIMCILTELANSD